MCKVEIKSLRAGEFGDIGDCDERRQKLLELEYRFILAYAGRKIPEKCINENSLENYMKNFWYGT